MENILFAIYIVLILCVLFIIYGIIKQYEQYHDVDLDTFYHDLSKITPLNYKSGDLIIVKTIGKISHLIRSTFGEDYNHCGILFFGPETISNLNTHIGGNIVPYIYHATILRGIELIKLSDYLLNGDVEWIEIISIPQVKKYHRHSIKKFILDNVGKNYRCPIWIFIAAKYNFDIYKYLPLSIPDGYHCVEFVSVFYKEYIGIPNIDALYYSKLDKYLNNKLVKSHNNTIQKIYIPKNIGMGFLNAWCMNVA
jgi:hypothetical protein